MMHEKILEKFIPFEVEVESYGLFEIWPAKLVQKFNIAIKDQEFEEISSTAIVTSYPRIFTDIPYEKDIYN